MEGVKAPIRKQANNEGRNVYDVEEVKTLLEAAQDEPEHSRIFISLSFATDMRRDELIALE